MKKVLIGLVVALVVVLGFFCFGQKENKSAELNDKPVVKIGAILPLTGNTSTFGQAYKNGILLAEDNINKNTKFNYKLIVEDNADNMKNVPIIAKKLLDYDNVSAILTIFDPMANVVAPIAADKDIIHIGVSWFPDFLKYHNNYNVHSSIYDQSDILAKKIAKEKYKNVVLFTINQTGFINETNILKEKLNENSIKICDEINFNFGIRDFRTEIAQTHNKCNPDLYILGAFAPESDILIKQLREIVGDKVVFTGIELGVNVSSYKIYDNYWFSAPALPDDKFMKEYTEKYSDETFINFAGMGYTEIGLLIDAFENAETESENVPTAEEVSKYLHNKKVYNSIFGKIDVTEHGQIDIPVNLMEIKNGKPVVIE